MKCSHWYVLLLTCPWLDDVGAFVVSRRQSRTFPILHEHDQVDDTNHDDASQGRAVVRAPLKFLGPYPALSLRFPDAATASQRDRGVKGVSLDFVIDTAANVNTLNGQVAKELDLAVVGEALPGVSSSGAMDGGQTYLLGDAQLESVLSDGEISEDEVSEPFLFMQNLTASVLPIGNPASAGLLSLAFLYCFEGGVEFNWGSPATQGSQTSVQPSISFLGKLDDAAEKAVHGLSKVKIDPIPTTFLPSIIVKINGIEMPALLDTGSPITVLNARAAEQAQVQTTNVQKQSSNKDSNNPFSAVLGKFKEAQALSQAVASGDIIRIGGISGPVDLLRSQQDVKIDIESDKDDVSFGSNRVYVGDIPGLAALNGIGIEAPPAVVLGMDVLKQRPKMVLRARENMVYF